VNWKITFSLFLIWFSIIGAQAPDTLWTRLYGGPGNDYGYWLDETSDGGFIAVGSYSWGVGDTDFYLIKTNGDGDTLWTSVFGGDYYDVCRWVYQTPDNGYIVAGLMSSDNNTDEDIYIFKTDSLGNLLWDKTYGGDQEDGVVTARPTSDGGYIVLGYTPSFGLGYMDIWLLKLDSDGDTLWTKTYGSESYDYGGSIIQEPDSGYFVLCNIFQGADNRMTLIRTDADGDSLWSRNYLGIGTSGKSIIPASGGGYMIMANTLEFGDEFDIQLLRIDENADSLWSGVYGNVDIDMGNSLWQSDDGGFVICGINGPYFNEDIYVLKTDAYGDTLWSWTFNGTPYGNDWGSCARPTTGGGVILTGSLSTDDYLQEACLIRIGSDQVRVDEDIRSRRPVGIELISNYPNPFNASTVIGFKLPDYGHVDLTVYDISGRAVKFLLHEYMQGGMHEVSFDGSAISSGIYFYRLRTREATVTKKMLLIK